MSHAIRAVLFDRDDTIAYTDQDVQRQAAIWTAQKHQLEPQLVGHTLAQLWQEKTSDWWHLRTLDQEAEFWRGYGLELTKRLNLDEIHAPELMASFPYERYMKPVEGAHEVLSALRGQGLKIGVLSNTLPSIDRTLEAVGLADLVDVALATCTLGVHKPEQEAYLLAAEALELAPQEILFVDDKPENVEAARQVGMQATLIDLRGQHPDAIHDLRAVLELVAP